MTVTLIAASTVTFTVTLEAAYARAAVVTRVVASSRAVARVPAAA